MMIWIGWPWETLKKAATSIEGNFDLMTVSVAATRPWRTGAANCTPTPRFPAVSLPCSLAE